MKAIAVKEVEDRLRRLREGTPTVGVDTQETEGNAIRELRMQLKSAEEKQAETEANLRKASQDRDRLLEEIAVMKKAYAEIVNAIKTQHQSEETWWEELVHNHRELAESKEKILEQLEARLPGKKTGTS